MNRRSVLVLTVAAACGCARVSSPLGDNLGGNGGSGMQQQGGPGASPDMAVGDAPDLANPSATPGDLATATRDLSTALVHDLATPPDLASPAPPPDLATVANCHLVVNELQTGTSQSARAEFVEVYNPCSSALTVDNFVLVYRPASDTNPASSGDSSTLYHFSGSLAAGGYLVLAGADFTGTSNGALSSGLAPSGAVAIRDGSGAIIDSVAYGSVSAGHAFIETSPAPLPPTVASPGGSIERLPNGHDSNDNSQDFQTTNTSTPGVANH